MQTRPKRDTSEWLEYCVCDQATPHTTNLPWIFFYKIEKNINFLFSIRWFIRNAIYIRCNDDDDDDEPRVRLNDHQLYVNHTT